MGHDLASSMDTLELCGDILQPGGQLETPGLVVIVVIVIVFHNHELCYLTIHCLWYTLNLDVYKVCLGIHSCLFFTVPTI